MTGATRWSWLGRGGRVAIMGILNVTPDSFSDGGLFLGPDQVVRRVAAMIEEGVDIVDIGGESTRPGAAAVEPEEELRRVIPAIEAIRRHFAIPLSVDTSEPAVMEAAVGAGADVINDVRALRRPGALAAAARLQAPVCLMHAQGEPGTMQSAPRYENVVQDVAAFLRERLEACQAAGIREELLAIDPGFGFGKTLDHNVSLLKGLPVLAAMGPVVIGLSRKTMTGVPFGLAVQDRLYTSIGMALAAVHLGARVVRVHDVRATREAVRAWELVFEPKE
ncbi:MAG: dihydropteroate synthase [Gammaproteobacteria bacterium]|nr:dihydropteroate synthase [Gammaproteobacteria bacterium]